MKLKSLFFIRREERWPALFVLALLVVLNALVVARYYADFTPLRDSYWGVIVRKFYISGFDPITYDVVSQWSAKYNVYRHPLLAFFMFVPYLLNQGLMWLTGINCAVFVVALMLVVSGFYSFVFLRRICRELAGCSSIDATLLSVLCFSFAYVLLSAAVPDHFIMSMAVLLLTLWLTGRKMKSGNRFTIGQTILLFVLTAGISLNNGLKTFLAALFTNGRRFFAPKYLLLAVVVPAALMWLFARWEYRTFVWPQEMARKELSAKRTAERKQRDMKAFADTTSIKDTARQQAAFKAEQARKARQKEKAKQEKPWNKHAGKPIAKGEFSRWTDISTPRWPSTVENLFGESIQLHQKHLLQDVLRSQRPFIVGYNWVLNYVVEGVLLLLFAGGIIACWRERLLWVALSWFALDMLLHVGLGFGLNEVYIMAAHWLFVIPVAISFLFARLSGTWQKTLRAVVAALTAYLLIYNISLLVQFLFL